VTHDAADIVAPEHAVAEQSGSALRYPELAIFVLALILLCSAVAMMVLTPDDLDFGRPFGSWTFVIIVALFGLTELSVFRVHFRRESISFALNEVPIAFAFVFLDPLVAPLSRIPLTAMVLILVRRNRSYKFAFNMSLHVFEVSFAGLLFHGLVRWMGSGSSAVVLSAAIALMIVTPITSALIAVAISLLEGGMGERIISELRATWWFYMFNSVLAAMTIALALFEPELTLLSVLPILGMWYLIHSYGNVSQELRDLDAVHGFAGRVGDTLDVGAIGDVAVTEAMDMFRASGSLLIRFEPDQNLVHASGSLSVPDGRPVDPDAWRRVTRSGEVVQLDRGQVDELGIDAESSIAIVLVTPVRDGGELLAVLAVARDDLIHDQFDAGDRGRLKNIGRQLSVSLRRGMLHERLEWEARHDALTELPSRTLFERSVSDAIEGRSPGMWGVMMLDLDRFKEVNDTLGHHAGDELLVEFSRRMTSILQPQDVLARLAGDEFAILCRRRSNEEILDLAQTCVREGGRPVTLDGLEIVVTVSVGVAEITSYDGEAIQPMRRADIAMYNAKWQRTGVEFYRDEIDRRTPARLSMLGDLRTAIETDQLTVVYQPKLHLGTGAIVGAEALVRWDHPTRGTVPPSEFVRVAEDTGLIKQLTDLVLASGISMLADFQRSGLDVGLAVNLSTHDLFDARLPDRVRGYLDSHGVDPSKLTLEITESSLFVDAPRTRATIDGLFEVGLRLAIDDFGTGYSSLSYLRRLPVHELKIDQSFVARMLVDAQDEVIVRSTVDLGHNLGLVVVAEGVESFDILDRLREVGCDVAQGYAISEPVLSSDILEWLQGSGHRAWQSALD
jgi:diguanylate cyclase (GGDEF)-like protein